MANNDLAVEDEANEYDESEPVVLEDTDKQCGHVFYNEDTRVLKFFCTFCRETYDNINVFCMHLSDHIAEETKLDDLSAVDEIESYLNTETDSLASHQPIEDVIEYPPDVMAVGEDDITNDTDIKDEFNDLDNDTTTQNVDNVPDELHHSSDSPQCDEREFASDPTKEGSMTQKLSNRQSFLNFSKLRKRKNRVTTVKVIAVKNRIAELYERIKREEEKRSQELATTMQHPNDDISIEQTEAVASPNPKDGLQRKIIGETLITLLPPKSDGPPEPSPASKQTTATRPDNARDRTCLACGKVFRSSFSLAIHRRSHYLESDSNIKLAHKCSDCDRLFNKIKELKEHVKVVHYPDGFVCKICNKRLSRLSLLELHMRKVHLARPFSCEICKKCFSDREDYEVHVNSHSDGKDYRCSICGRKYPSDNVLQYHMKRHKEPVPQSCVVCGKKTLRITQHMKIHTPRPKRILSCSVCGKVFNFSSGLSHHFKVMHKLPRPPPKPKKHHVSNAKKQKASSGATTDVNTEAAPSRAEPTKVEECKIEWTTLDEIAMDQKEEEAKRVIVELIQNAAYTPCYLPDNNHYEAAPPIAREETISAINSIVPEELELDIK